MLDSQSQPSPIASPSVSISAKATPRVLPAQALLTALALGGILLIGGLLRFRGLNWADGILLHPDEYFVSDVTGRLSTVDNLTDYFDTLRSPLNPNNVGKGFYVYGTLPIILTRYVGEAQDRSGLFDMLPLGRQLSAIADILIVPLIFLIGWRLFNVRVGLLGALLYAAAGFPIQQAHFYTVDTFAALFTTAAFYFAVRVLKSRHLWLDASIFGLLLGMGMASKITAVVMAVILMLALLIRWAKDENLTPDRSPHAERGEARKEQHWRAVIRAVLALVLGGVFTVAAFRVFQPYAFLAPNTYLPPETYNSGAMVKLGKLLDPIGMRPNPQWLNTMKEVGYQGSGAWDAPPNHQWATRTKLLFPLKNIIAVGLGWPLGVIAWLAVLWAIWEIARRNPGFEGLLLIVGWVLLIFLWQGTRWVMTMRYFLPIYPQLVILAAWLPITLWDRVQALLAERGAPRWHPAAWIGVAFGVIAAVGGLLWGIAVGSIYVRPITRIAGSQWVAEHVPSDISFGIETPDGARNYEFGLYNDWIAPGQQYEPITYTSLAGGMPRPIVFNFPFGGELTSIRLNHVAAMQPGDRKLRVTLSDANAPLTPLAEGTIEADFYAGGEPRGDAYEITFDAVKIDATHSYMLTLEPDAGDMLILSGSTLAHEGDWDWPMPFNFAPYDMWGTQLQGYQLQLIMPGDTPEKRDRLQYILDRADYLTISSNRFYHTVNRNPRRYPLTIAYYKALFSGELGFELAADFTSRPALGNLEFCDDFAEEAWSVYDHPRVFIFRKTAAYDPQNTSRILGAVDLSKVENLVANEVHDRPVTLDPPGACHFIHWR